MRAVLLCGGQGTRLREHTELRPKPMVRWGASDSLYYESYSYYGVTDLYLSRL